MAAAVAAPMGLPTGIINDHPHGADIRRQVEFYFSDENLRTDKHLLECCNGRQNNPISISRILGFKKMRVYKQRTLIVAALRRSAFLEVTADGKQIRRIIPLTGKNVLDADFYGDDGGFAYDPRVQVPVISQTLPQTKKMYPPGMSKNMMKPTGFEDTFIDAPLTPAEAAEEEALYDEDKPFVERIELAIQRFKQKKRMHEMYAIVFNKWMRFGGVDQTQRMYQGTSPQELAQMEAEEIARALATHTVPWDRTDKKQWVVDFPGVVKAFLSSWYPTHYGYTKSNSIKYACQVPRAFFRYLRIHSVCPEYDGQLQEALKICDLAETELPRVVAATSALPGDFNKSASIVFGGTQAGTYAGDKSWAADMKKEGMSIAELGIRDEEARIIFTTGVGIIGTEEQFEKLATKTFKVLRNLLTNLEVIEIQPPTELTKTSYAVHSKHVQHKLGSLEPVGKLICKTCHTEDCDEWDLPKDKYPNGKPKPANSGEIYEFWIEQSVLEECFVGMKMEARVLVLDGGLAILDAHNEVMCSFFTWLPNELWMDNKPKEIKRLPKGLPIDEDKYEINGDGEGAQAQADEGESDDE